MSEIYPVEVEIRANMPFLGYVFFQITRKIWGFNESLVLHLDQKVYLRLRAISKIG